MDTDDYNPHAPAGEAVGVDFGIKRLATLSGGTWLPANQKLKANLRRLRRLKRRQRRLSRKQKSSNPRAKARLLLAKLHKRVDDQRRTVLHEVSDRLTRDYKMVCIEDLSVKGMAKTPPPRPRRERCRIRRFADVHRLQSRAARRDGGRDRPLRAQFADVL